MSVWGNSPAELPPQPPAQRITVTIIRLWVHERNMLMFVVTTVALRHRNTDPKWFRCCWRSMLFNASVVGEASPRACKLVFKAKWAHLHSGHSRHNLPLWQLLRPIGAGVKEFTNSSGLSEWECYSYMMEMMMQSAEKCGKPSDWLELLVHHFHYSSTGIGVFLFCRDNLSLL